MKKMVFRGSRILSIVFALQLKAFDLLNPAVFMDSPSDHSVHLRILPKLLSVSVIPFYVKAHGIHVLLYTPHMVGPICNIENAVDRVCNI